MEQGSESECVQCENVLLRTKQPLGLESDSESVSESGNALAKISSKRMHSSRMRTVRNSSRMLGGWGVGDPPQLPPWLWAWTGSPSTSHLAVGLDLIPLNFPLGCGPGACPHWTDRLNFPLGCGPGNLQGMLGYTPPPRPAARHAGIPPVMHAGIAPPVDRHTPAKT